jgi:erythromycin esterase
LLEVVVSDDERDELLVWLRASHHPLNSLEQNASADDLAPLREIIGDAKVIGIGETVRGARSAGELRRFAHRVLRFAVDELGVRALVLEERTLEAANALDTYVRTGAGSSEDALRAAWSPWQSVEVLTVLGWLRERNALRADDQVRVVGAISEDEIGLAGHVLDWMERTGDRIVYWGGAAHSAVSSANDLTHPPRSPPGPSDGTQLRRALGTAYLSVGCICDHAVAGEPLPPPPSYFAEAPLANVEPPVWYLDVREPVDDAARRWAGEPATTRLIGPQYDPRRNAQFCMSGTPFGAWFDAILYVREITPTRPLR